MMESKRIYEELRKHYTDEEIADAHLIPADLTEEEMQQAQEEIRKYRFELLKKETEQDRIFSDLVRLRLLMNECVQQESFSKEHDFANFLQQYIHITKKSKQAFAADIDIHQTRLSRLLKNREDPSISLLYRLEAHSGDLIPAVLWWKLLIKKQEYEIKQNIDRRKEEAAKVRNRLRG